MSFISLTCSSLSLSDIWSYTSSHTMMASRSAATMVSRPPRPAAAPPASPPRPAARPSGLASSARGAPLRPRLLGPRRAPPALLRPSSPARPSGPPRWRLFPPGGGGTTAALGCGRATREAERRPAGQCEERRGGRPARRPQRLGVAHARGGGGGSACLYSLVPPSLVPLSRGYGGGR